jgi:cytochrome P450
MGFGSATSEALSVILGRGSIFLLSGAAHRRTRTLLAPPFHGERTRAYAEATQRAARRWSATLERDRVVPILSVTQKITLDVIIEAIFGEQDPSRVKTLHTKILAVVEAFNPMIASFKLLQREFGGLGPWARFQARARALHADLSALIEGKRDRPDDDVLSLLLSASDERGDPLAEDEIIDQLITFVIAGHEDHRDVAGLVRVRAAPRARDARQAARRDRRRWRLGRFRRGAREAATPRRGR